MRDYSKVSPQFWIGETGKKIRDAGIEAVVVSIYLLTSPHANMMGLYYCPIEYIAHETGLTHQGASKGLQRAIEAGFCTFEAHSEIVWIFEMAKYQVEKITTDKDNKVKGLNKEYSKLPKCGFINDFYEKYKERFLLDEPRNNEAPYKPLRSMEQEQEQEQEKDKTLSRFEKPNRVDDRFYLTRKKKKLKGKCLEDFEMFWREFSHPNGKAEAADSWLVVYSPENFPLILEGAKREAMERPSLVAQGKTPKWAQGWLSGRRWEDMQGADGPVYKKLTLPPPPEEQIRLKKEAALNARTSADH